MRKYTNARKEIVLLRGSLSFHNGFSFFFGLNVANKFLPSSYLSQQLHYSQDGSAILRLIDFLRFIAIVFLGGLLPLPNLSNFAISSCLVLPFIDNDNDCMRTNE